MSDELLTREFSDSAVRPEETISSATASQGRADRFMRRLLLIPSTDRNVLPGAHRAFRLSLLISAVRCTIMYVLVPILVPVVSLATVLTVPIDVALCLFAGVNGVLGVRRFWRADHRAKWKYTAFVGLVFAVMIVSLMLDAVRMVSS